MHQSSCVLSILARTRAVLLFSALASPAVCVAAGNIGNLYPLSVDPTHRYLVNRKGGSYLIQGDSAWSLIVGATNEEVEKYLADRQAKGFNSILVNLVEHKFCKYPPNDKEGEGPFGVTSDFSTPNEKYFAHADWVIHQAAKHGIMVILFPLYLGAEGTNEGFFREALANGPAKCRAYGEYVGKRYRDFDNLIWAIGGDRDPKEALEDVEALASGIRSIDHRHLMTAHCRSEHSAARVYGTDGWLDLNSTYTYQLVHPKLLEDFNRRPVRPYFLVETTYEGEHNSTPLQIRRQAYWAVLSGATGQVMGNCPVWGFDYFVNWESGDDNTNSGEVWPFTNRDRPSDVKRGLDSTGSKQLAFLHKLFDSRPWYRLIPDQTHSVVTHGLGELTGTDYLAAARADDGSTMMAYMPTARTITVDVSKIGGEQAKAWWVSPRTGTATASGSYPTQGSRDFSPPGPGDWVLVLDDSSRRFTPPGTLQP